MISHTKKTKQTQVGVFLYRLASQVGQRLTGALSQLHSI
jgi:hypothetical protein